MLTPEVSPEEMMLQQAVEFIDKGNYADARDLLTRLVKADQNNVSYWVWLSAAMETQKERLYCLQTALKLDPENAAAKRGLTLLGGLPPDETLQPFPMNHPRPWDSKIKLADDTPRPTGFKALAANPIARVVALLLAGALLIGGVIGGFSIAASMRPEPTRRIVISSTPLPTSTPNMTVQVQERGPLAGLIAATYTPTLVYAATPHEDAARDAYRGAIRAYSNEQWPIVADLMKQVATVHPGSVDTIYFVAEAYRLDGKYKEALEYYQEAIKIDPNFAPIYLGRARANLALNPKKAVMSDYDAAINLDPNYGEAYLERGSYWINHNNSEAAMEDLRRAKALLPDSPLVQVALARAELEQGNNPEALEAALRANELDVTMLESYLVLGMAYRANGEVDKALETLEIYTQYSDDNSEAFAFLGATYFNRGEFDKALAALDKALQLDRTSSQGYFWRGETHLALENYEKALDDFRASFRSNQNSFDAGLGIARAHAALEDYNNSAAALQTMEKLVRTDKQRAVYLYYRAIALGNIGYPKESYRDWQAILDLPEDTVPAEIRAEAQEKVESYRTPTPEPPTITPSKTATPTQTRKPSTTPTPTP